jgi:CheY-like chemotaxis protein
VHEKLVLVVDDDPEMRDSMEMLLQSDGYAVVTAEHGEAALTSLRGGISPCAILLDLMMPVMDGFQFRQEQLSDPRIAAIPVITYSGHYDVQANAARLRPAAYFQKPVDPDVLLALIREQCREH